jgi:hypothetical protein
VGNPQRRARHKLSFHPAHRDTEVFSFGHLKRFGPLLSTVYRGVGKTRAHSKTGWLSRGKGLRLGIQDGIARNWAISPRCSLDVSITRQTPWSQAKTFQDG